MSKKRIVLSVLFLFLLPVVFAAGPLDRVYDLLGDVTSRIFFDMTTVSQQTFVLWMKTLLFFMLFALYSLILPFIPLFGKKEGATGSYHPHAKRLGMIVSAALALTSVIMIPASILVAISSTYGFLAATLFLLAPLVGLVIGLNKAFPTAKEVNNQENKHRGLYALLHALAYYLFATILHNFTDAVQTSGAFGLQAFSSWSVFIEGLALIAFIVYLIMALFFLLGKEKAVQPTAQPQQNIPPQQTTPSTGPAPTPPRTQPSRLPQRPQPTVHPPWPTPSPKHNPTPPPRPQFPEEREIPSPQVPPPTRHIDVVVDLSPGFLPIKNQQGSSACAGFAGNAIVEYYMNSSAGAIVPDHDLSELFLWYNGRRDKQANRGVRKNDLIRTLVTQGTCFEPLWAWDTVDQQGIPLRFMQQPDARAYANALEKRVANIRELSPNDPDSWVDELLKRNPIFLGIDVDEAFYSTGFRGELYAEKGGRVFGGHAVVLVGFATNYPDPRDQQKSVAAFKIRNSWGSGWGEEGYIWVTRDLLPTILIWNPLVFEGIKQTKEQPKSNGLNEQHKKLVTEIQKILECAQPEKEILETLVEAERQEATATIELLQQKRTEKHQASVRAAKKIDELVSISAGLLTRMPTHEKKQQEQIFSILREGLQLIQKQYEDAREDLERVQQAMHLFEQTLQTLILQIEHQRRTR